MEWIETTAKSVQEAKDMALDNLGVDEAEAEFEVLEEPKAGLFGRVRGQARVRARVVPKSPRPKAERGDRKRTRSRRTTEDQDAPAAAVVQEQTPGRGGGSSPTRDAESGSHRKRAHTMNETSVDEVRDTVAQFVQGLTAAFGIDTPCAAVIDEDGAIEATIEGKHGLLLGPKGRTLEAIQELCRVSAQRSAPSSARIRIDVGGYREARRQALEAFAANAAARAISEQVEVVLDPMTASDRKIIHDSLGEVAGVTTRSAGNDPRRRVVVVPDRDGETVDAGHDDGDDESPD